MLKAISLTGFERARLQPRRTMSDKIGGFTVCGKTHRELHEVSGHDFSRAVSAIKPLRALHAAENLTVALSCACFVTGHDFSRATTALESTRASAPAKACSSVLLTSWPFSAACLAPAGVWTGRSVLMRWALFLLSMKESRCPARSNSSRHTPLLGSKSKYARATEPAPPQAGP